MSLSISLPLYLQSNSPLPLPILMNNLSPMYFNSQILRQNNENAEEGNKKEICSNLHKQFSQTKQHQHLH